MRRVVCFLLLTVMWAATADAQAPFYQGKTITFVVAAKAGDVYDLYPRLLAEYMPKHIPGTPNIIVQNVAGAAGLIGTNQLYNTAKPDGLTLGATYPALYFEQLAQRPEVKFDWNKFIWIGSPVSSKSLMYMRADSPYQDRRRYSHGQQHRLNAAPRASPHRAYLHAKAYGRCRSAPNSIIVSGYVAGSDIDLAVERGEVMCRAFTINALLCPRAVYYLAQEKFCSRALPDRQPTATSGSRTCRCSKNSWTSTRPPVTACGD